MLGRHITIATVHKNKLGTVEVVNSCFKTLPILEETEIHQLLFLW